MDHLNQEVNVLNKHIYEVLNKLWPTEREQNENKKALLQKQSHNFLHLS